MNYNDGFSSPFFLYLIIVKEESDKWADDTVISIGGLTDVSHAMTQRMLLILLH